MAKYAISQEGLDSLDKLSAGLMQVVTGIDDACKTLYTKIERLESGLGVYEKTFCFVSVRLLQRTNKGKMGSHLVTTAIPRQKAIIEEIMAMVDGTSGDDEAQPPQKKLVLRRR